MVKWLYQAISTPDPGQSGALQHPDIFPCRAVSTPDFKSLKHLQMNYKSFKILLTLISSTG